MDTRAKKSCKLEEPSRKNAHCTLSPFSRAPLWHLQGDAWRRPYTTLFPFSLALCLAIFSLVLSGPPAGNAAENLRLREGLSFVHDLDKGFPILGDKMDDVKFEPGKVSLLFFGAAGDLNTNRQARREIEIYKKYKEQLKFIVVDVDHVNSTEAKQLIKSYYQGYIPQEVIIDKQGKTFWTHIGEIDTSALTVQIVKVLN